MSRFDLRRLRIVAAWLVAVSLQALPAGAQPVNEAALAAASSFLVNPREAVLVGPQAPGHAGEIDALAEGVKLKAFGEPKLVYTDDAVAIAAAEATFPGLQQSFYIRVRRNDGRWSVTDWTSVSSLRFNFQMMQKLDKASEAEKLTFREQNGGRDFEAGKENVRLLLGSDEVFLKSVSADLSDFKAVCRALMGISAELGMTSIRPLDPEMVRGLTQRFPGHAELARILVEAHRLNLVEIVKEGDSANVVLSGLPTGAVPTSFVSAVRRILLCVPGPASASLQLRLNARTTILGVRDLGDGFYFVRGSGR